jgi:hypothetical protein
VGLSLETFRASLAEGAPPADQPAPIRALWHAGRGEWEAAHGIVQADEGDPVNAWVHAHLHRQEGDLGNAAYWYRRAGKPVATASIEAEWEAIVAALLVQ